LFQFILFAQQKFIDVRSNDERQYKASCSVTKLTTLFALIADMVGNDMPVRLAIEADMNIVLFD
jgi:hypothetical protein